jgi:hypothetical protein
MEQCGKRSRIHAAMGAGEHRRTLSEQVIAPGICGSNYEPFADLQWHGDPMKLTEDQAFSAVIRLRECLDNYEDNPEASAAFLLIAALFTGEQQVTLFRILKVIDHDNDWLALTKSGEQKVLELLQGH